MVKIAILGAGFMGSNHADAYGNIKKAQLVAVCDQNKQLAEEFARKYGCGCYTDFEEMVRDCAFDVADLCLPTFLHETYVLRASAHKKHIFCEKPVTLCVPSLDRMIKGVKESGVQMMVGQVVRFWPEYANAKKCYDSGELGDLKAVYAARLSEHPAWSQWYIKPELSGGGLLDLHLHDIDFMCYLLGTVRHVYGVGQKNKYGCWNHVNTILTFENGISATVEGIIEMTKGYPFTMQLRLVGAEKTYDYLMKAGANLEDVASARRETAIYGPHCPVVLPVNERDAYEIELEHFVWCIENHVDSPVITVEQVRQVLCTMEAIKESLETGEKVAVRY